MAVCWLTNWHTESVFREKYVRMVFEWVFSREGELATFLAKRSILFTFHRPNAVGLEFRLHEALNESCTGHWKGPLCVLRIQERQIG